MSERNPDSGQRVSSFSWRREARYCAQDRMFGCAAFALSQWLLEHPDQDTPAQREQIAAWRELGDVAIHDTAQERAARAIEAGRTRQKRRFGRLLAHAEKATLTEVEAAELSTLAAALDARG